MTKPKPKAKPKPKRKTGQPAVDDIIAMARDRTLTEQMQRTARAVFARIERMAEHGHDIPISMLGAARIFAEWHTDYMTVAPEVDELVPSITPDVRAPEPH